MRSDIEIAQQADMRPIAEVAEEAGILGEELELYGRYKAKVSLGLLGRLDEQPRGRYVVVTAVTPTPLGEGKTVTTVGLGQALRRAGERTVTCIRQPSLGPVFGIKGGAAGGGYSQVLPMEDINLHLTGDMHAVTAAHNTCAAFLDNRLYQGDGTDIDPYSVVWRRVVDVSDRALRKIVVGLGGRPHGVPRESGYDITAASELMAVLALGSDLRDLRSRVGRIVVARSRDEKPVTTEDLGVAGAMTVLLKDALKPNLVQDLEGGPVFVHTGPFANIAHGNSSIVADRMARRLADYTVTEAGFGADMGFEKAMNIKSRASGTTPDAAVLVCTVRALKMHSGRFDVRLGRGLPSEMEREDLDVLREGACNLTKQIHNVRSFGVPVVVAINVFPTDTEAEHEEIARIAMEAGARDAVTHRMYADGAEGGLDLASAVMEACGTESGAKLTYDDWDSVHEKISSVARRVYGADGVDFLPEAERSIARYERWGYGSLPVCMAKTHLSLSHDPTMKGCPSGWILPVRNVRLSAGAGFMYALCGDIMTMPGLPARPAGEGIDIDEDGKVVGLS